MVGFYQSLSFSVSARNSACLCVPMASDWERGMMDDLSVPQNPEELMWYRPSLCPQSPSLLSGSENESDGDAENREGVSMIPPTPERSRPEKRAHSSSRKNLFQEVCATTNRY